MKKKIVSVLTMVVLLAVLLTGGMTVGAQETPSFGDFSAGWYPVTSLTPERGTMTGHFSFDQEMGMPSDEEIAAQVREGLMMSLYPDQWMDDITEEDVRYYLLDQAYSLDMPVDIEAPLDEIRMAIMKGLSMIDFGELVFAEDATLEEAMEAYVQAVIEMGGGFDGSFYEMAAFFLDYYGIPVDDPQDADAILAKIRELYPDRDVQGFDRYVFEYDLALKGVGDGALKFDFALDLDYTIPEWIEAFLGQMIPPEEWENVEDFEDIEIPEVTVSVFANGEELDVDAANFEIPLEEGYNKLVFQVKESTTYPSEGSYEDALPGISIEVDPNETVVASYIVNINVEPGEEESDPSDPENPDSSDPEKTDPSDPEKTDSSDPGKDDSSKPSSSEKDSSKPSSSQKPGKSPNTGEAGAAGIVVLAAGASAALVLLRKKK